MKQSLTNDVLWHHRINKTPFTPSDATLSSYFKAIQQKLLFGCIVDEKERKFVFFERQANLTPIEHAIVEKYAPTVCFNVKKFIFSQNGCLHFYEGLNEWAQYEDVAICRQRIPIQATETIYANEFHSYCIGRIRPTIYNQRWMYRIVGEPGTLMHIAHSSALIPIQNIDRLETSKVLALIRARVENLKGPKIGIVQYKKIPDEDFNTEATCSKNKSGKDCIIINEIQFNTDSKIQNKWRCHCNAEEKKFNENCLELVLILKYI